MSTETASRPYSRTCAKCGHENALHDETSPACSSKGCRCSDFVGAVYTPRLCKCGKPVQKTVIYINRRTRNENSRAEMCDEHVQQEITLATTGLSMVDIDIQPLT